MKSKIHRATGTRGVDGFVRSCGNAPESMRTTRSVAREIMRVNADNRIAEQAAIA
jgi:hypothetical protein